jgi:hypothetical protein
MVYDEDGDQVVYRRDTRIRWAKGAHSIIVRGVPVLHPVISLLFKLNKAEFRRRTVRISKP